MPTAAHSGGYALFSDSRSIGHQKPGARRCVPCPWPPAFEGARTAARGTLTGLLAVCHIPPQVHAVNVGRILGASPTYAGYASAAFHHRQQGPARPCPRERTSTPQRLNALNRSGR
jgi:hypothetical protein